jgi:hypothetical protein
MLERILDQPLVRLACLLGLYVGALACYIALLRRDAILVAPLLDLLPAPPGAVHKVQRGASRFRRGSRAYDVERPYQEVARFFRVEFPRRGWRLVEERAHAPPEGVASVELVFRGPYIMPLRMGVRVAAGLHAGVQTGRTRVGIHDRNVSVASSSAYL